MHPAMRIQDHPLRITLDHYRLGHCRCCLWIMFRTLFHSSRVAVVQDGAMMARGCGSHRAVGIYRGRRRGKVQLTFWHDDYLGGGGGCDRVMVMVDQVLGAFVLGRQQVEFNGLSFVAALFQTPVVNRSRRFVFRTPCPDDPPGHCWRMTRSGRTGTGIRSRQRRCASTVV